MNSSPLLAALLATTLIAPVSLKAAEPAVSQTVVDADGLIRRVKAAQAQLGGGGQAYFELLAGGPASYDMTRVAPRQAFLEATFDKAVNVRKLPSGNLSWKPYHLEIWPAGRGNAYWDVEVVLGFYDQISRIEMTYRPPPP